MLPSLLSNRIYLYEFLLAESSSYFCKALPSSNLQSQRNALDEREG